MNTQRKHIECLGMDALKLKRPPGGYGRLEGTLMFNFSGRSENNSILRNAQSYQLLPRQVSKVRGTPPILSLATGCHDILVGAPLEFHGGIAHAIVTDPAFDYENFRRQSVGQRKEGFSVNA